MVLCEGKNGEVCVIRKIPQGPCRGQALRLGLREGLPCRIVRASAKGAVVLETNGTLLAIGHELAGQIRTEETDTAQTMVTMDSKHPQTDTQKTFRTLQRL